MKKKKLKLEFTGNPTEVKKELEKADFEGQVLLDVDTKGYLFNESWQAGDFSLIADKSKIIIDEPICFTFQNNTAKICFKNDGKCYVEVEKFKEKSYDPKKKSNIEKYIYGKYKGQTIKKVVVEEYAERPLPRIDDHFSRNDLVRGIIFYLENGKTISCSGYEDYMMVSFI